MTADDQRRPPAPTDPPPRRLHARSLAWLAVVGVGVAAALFVSYRAERSSSVDLEQPPVDQAALCGAAAQVRSLGSTDLDLSTAADRFTGVVDALNQVAVAAPAVAAQAAAVATSLEPVITAAQQAAPDDPGALGRVVSALEAAEQEAQAQSNELADYLERWCGPPEPGPATTSGGVAGGGTTPSTDR